MPLNVEHIRDGEPIAYEWDNWHLWCIEEVVQSEEGSMNHHTVNGEYVFEHNITHEKMVFTKGDEIRTWMGD